MISIDELIRDILPAPEADSIETAGLSAARTALDGAIAAASADRHPPRLRASRLAMPLRHLPALAGCAVALLIGAAGLVLVHHRPASPSASPQSANVPAAAGLIARLGVLRRPQTAVDRLPAALVAGWERQTAQEDVGRLLPALTRLVAVRGPVRLYLAVTTPAPGPNPLWSPRDGDQVTVVAITPRGMTASPSIPAVALSDPDILSVAGLTLGQGTSPNALAAARGYAYDVAIVPDGVARVHWTLANRDGGVGEAVRVTVQNNAAVSPLSRTTTDVLLSGEWYAANGHRVATRAVLTQALDARQAERQRQALAAAERQHVTASTRILHAFAVFSFGSPAGTRLPDGYIISRPPLTDLPFAVLNLGGRQGLDLRQARRVQAPSGLSMYVVPGTSTVCVFEVDAPVPLPHFRRSQGGGGGCSGSLDLALTGGAGVDVDDGHGAVQYGVVPKSSSGATILLRGGRRRTLHPEDGVYIVPTPFTFG